MIDWNALAEQHKRGSTDLERTVTLLCREMAKLVPQEMVWPDEPATQGVAQAPKPALAGDD